jgi:hypothetical protein
MESPNPPGFPPGMIPLSHLPPGIIPPFPPPPGMMPLHPLPPDLVPLFPSGGVASLVSVDTILDTSDGMQGVQNSHPQLQTRAESHSPPGASILSYPSSVFSHISFASSIETIKSLVAPLSHLPYHPRCVAHHLTSFFVQCSP